MLDQALLTQWLEYLFYTEKVVRSSRAESTNNAGYTSGEVNGLISRSEEFDSATRNQLACIAQLDRATAFEAVGWEFESL